VAPEKLRVILNAADLGIFRRDPETRWRKREEWGIDDAAFAIGTVGRMAPEKNHALLLSAVAPLLGRDCALVIAGDGSERPATERLARELGVDAWVRFLGETRDVSAVLSGLDLFVLSSHFEGLPMVLLEAMGTSLPVVATAVGGVPGVVSDGETGCLVADGDAEALRATVLRLRKDPLLLDRMGRRARELALQRHSLERMANEYFDAYGIRGVTGAVK
jgi:glycosyltransferase involved in cell wall biosynthesis